MALPLRPLGTVQDMLAQLGHEITYAYDDLVFVQHNPFLLQFGATGDRLFFYANVEEPAVETGRHFDNLLAQAESRGITLINRGSYEISQGEGENLSLAFFDREERH